MSTLDWLKLPEEDEPPLPRRIDEARNPGVTKRALARQDARRVARTERTTQLTTLLRKLDWEQRLWLKALVKNAFSARKARKDLKDRRLFAPEPYKVSRWSTIPAFVEARELCAQLLYDGEMPSKTMLLLRLNKIAEYTAEEVDEYHQGEPTGRVNLRDVGASLKATEMMGKHLQMFGEEKSSVREGPQFIVQIISKDDPTKIIDVTPGRVQVTPIELEDVVDAEPVDGNT